jgi:ureidoglycolate hydrolase
VTTLPVEPLEQPAFSAFGTVIDRPQRAPDATGRGWEWWGETQPVAATGRGYGVGYLELQPAEPSFDWAERHMRSQELIAPLAGSILVYVGPPESPDQPDALPALERFRVFRVEPGQGVVLAPGVWHGAPHAEGGPARAMVLLQEGTGREDTVVARFEDSPVRIEGVRGADR